jgi:hypothetical protein
MVFWFPWHPNKPVLTSSIALLPPGCGTLHYMLDAELLFLQPQLVPHREKNSVCCITRMMLNCFFGLGA